MASVLQRVRRADPLAASAVKRTTTSRWLSRRNLRRHSLRLLRLVRKSTRCVASSTDPRPLPTDRPTDRANSFSRIQRVCSHQPNLPVWQFRIYGRAAAFGALIVINHPLPPSAVCYKSSSFCLVCIPLIWRDPPPRPFPPTAMH